MTPPDWVQHVAAIYLPLSIISGLLVLGDIFLLRRRQPMAIMDVVWPLTMLYWGPLGFIFYGWFGRGPADRTSGHHGGKPMWQATFSGATHCGAGCALGDFLGDWLAFVTGLAFFGSLLSGKFVLAFLLAYLFGIIFQYFSIAPMQKLGLREGVMAAIKIDTLSLLAYEIGMFMVMGARTWLYPHLEPTSEIYWLAMQIAMIAGFMTTYPVNWWLIRQGIKEKM
jgi:hypothetical protein